MSLKSIRESYSRLLTALSDAGVKLSESQKADVDSFVLAIESNMERQRKLAITQTERRMEKEYRQVFESIMANTHKNAELASAIQDRITRLNESKKMAEHVDNFLDLYVESVLPKKTIVDYDRMAKLERIQESLRDTLLVGEDAVEDKIQQLEESYKVKQSKCETQVAKARAELNESMKKSRDLKKKLDSLKAKELLESKTKDLPTYEARRVKKQLAEASAPEIEKKFDKTLESVRKRMDEDAKAAEKELEKTVESEIEDILEADDAEVEENDMLRDRPHNAHVSKRVSECGEVDEDDPLKGRVHNAHVKVDEGEEEEEFETMEVVREKSDGDIELDESDIIDSDLMQMWCNQSAEVN